MPRRKIDRSQCAECGTPKSDMKCPISEALDRLLDELADEGYEGWFNEIDARLAESGMSVCTNCGERGRFAYRGVRRAASYRAFWTCRACCHWVEV